MTRRALARGTVVLALVILALLALRPSSAASKKAPGDMGIAVSDLSPEACRAADVPYGVLVIGIVPGGPADKKDIREGDIITEYENEPVRSAAVLMGRIRRDGEGFLAGIRIHREGSDRWIGFVPLDAAPVPPPTRDQVEERFAQLEDEIDDLKARVATLEKARAIPRRQVLPKDDSKEDSAK